MLIRGEGLIRESQASSVMSQDTICSLMSRATATHIEERESELAMQRLDRKDEPGERSSERCQHLPERTSCRLVHAVDERVFSRSWQAESVDSGCSNSTPFAGACSEGLCGEGLCVATGGRCDRSAGKLSAVKVTVGSAHRKTRQRPHA